jgi:hypothetical protein
MASLCGRNNCRTIKSIAIALGLSAAFALAYGMPAHAQSDNIPSKTIDLNLNNAPVHQALVVLFQGAGLNFTMDPNVSGNVNVSLRGVSFETALKAVLKAANPPLVAVKDPDTGVYYIKVKDLSSDVTANGGGPNNGFNPAQTNPAGPGMGPGGAPAAAPTAAPFAAASTAAGYDDMSLDQWEPITLRYLDPTALKQIFRKSLFVFVSGTAANGGKGATPAASAFGGATTGSTTTAGGGGGGMQAAGGGGMQGMAGAAL